MEASGIIGLSEKLAGSFVSGEQSELLEFERKTRINRLDKNEIYRFLGEEPGRMAVEVVDRYSEAVNVARTKSWKFSLGYFERADAGLALLTGNAHLYARLFYHSGWSFFYYSKGVYAKAVAHLNQGLELSERLENQGAAFLAFRRILDQIPNLAKIHLQDGRVCQALELHNGILKALVYNDYTSLPGKWQTGMFDHDGYSRQRGIDDVMLNTTKTILAHSQRAEERALYEVIFRDIGHFEISNDHLEVIGRFISLKRSFFAQAHDAFLSKLNEFLVLPMDTCFDLLKLAVIANYLDLARKNMKGESLRRVCEKVDDYISFHLHPQPSERFLILLIYKEFPYLKQSNQPAFI
ncbi:hypothetical protein GCM10010967_15060 [Dyadobacter beijingensis]|uniref:Tetratricopeptide repeat protein n=1 Tax=Dyadobacter beijingensis TaxID=365489 RepID=A0ABQ2HLY1_9BACT|nr:hypothetical protein [Dyadobacter beijingensis]GGM84222.1 hypothetical protein GCM10010967_15060 [Dyadobacter beijingensis]